MASEIRIRRYRNAYARWIRLFPKIYRERFGEAMTQTFNDLLLERERNEKSLFGFALWTFAETSVAMIRENLTMIMKCLIDRSSTIFLRLVIALVAVAALAVCVFPLPRMIATEAAKTPETAWQIYLFLIVAYIQAFLFLIGLFNAFRLLGYIDGDEAFSEGSVRALRRIKCAAVTIAFLMMTGVAWVLYLSAGTGEDSAGPVGLGLMGTFASSVVAAAAAVLQQLLQKGVDTRKEVHA